jgi:hypothetical protein
MDTNTSPIKNPFPLMFLHLPTEIVLNHELNPESSALPGAEASTFSPTLARGGSSTPMTHTIISSNGVAATSSTPMPEGDSSTPMMEVARKQSASHNSADSLRFDGSYVACRTRGVDMFFPPDNPNFG